MATLASAVALLSAAILLWAGLDKSRDPRSTVATVEQLGVPGDVARFASLVIPAELAVACALVFRPDSLVTQAGVVSLAGAFAFAGLLARRLDEPIRCTCFGPGGHGYLGATQIVAFVPWAAAAAFLHVADVAAPSPSTGAVMFAGVALAIAGVRMISILGLWREARGDRRMAQETYSWLHR